jgi:hypothetical protein
MEEKEQYIPEPTKQPTLEELKIISKSEGC